MVKLRENKESVFGNNREAHCSVCQTAISVASMGINTPTCQVLPQSYYGNSRVQMHTLSIHY